MLAPDAWAGKAEPIDFFQCSGCEAHALHSTTLVFCDRVAGTRGGS